MATHTAQPELVDKDCTLPGVPPELVYTQAEQFQEFSLILYTQTVHFQEFSLN
jgi:hypothetical protein